MVIDIARSVKLTLGILKDDTELSPRKIKRLRDIANSYGMRFSIDLGERLYFTFWSDSGYESFDRIFTCESWEHILDEIEEKVGEVLGEVKTAFKRDCFGLEPRDESVYINETKSMMSTDIKIEVLCDAIRNAMYEDNLYKSENIVILDNPQEVDTIDWGLAHLNCDALFLDGSDYSKMIVIAYALNENGNNELLKIKEKNKQLKLFRGTDKSMLNRV